MKVPTVDWEKWKFLVETREGWAICALSMALFFCCCGYTCSRLCRKKDKIVASERFKWPSSKRFLKNASAAHPPPLVVNKFADPLRTDELPFGVERHWTLIYQPNGHREEVKQLMYLTMRDGKAFGVGFEKIRKVCKINGRYRHNAAANQTVLVMNCMFSNELDLVLLHGTGNGTAFVGNCYIREIDPFSSTSGIPGVRTMFGCKFKGSFILTMNNNMGGHNLRMMLHTNRVHKFAGQLFPDENGLYYGSDVQDADEDEESNAIGVSLKTLTPPLFTTGRRKSSTPSPRSGHGNFLSKIFRIRAGGGGEEWRHGELRHDTPPSALDDQLPWVMNDKRAERRGSERRGSLSPARSPRDGRYYAEGGRQQRRGSGTPGRRASQTLTANRAINHLNYLEMDEIPGRSGPSMV